MIQLAYLVLVLSPFTIATTNASDPSAFINQAAQTYKEALETTDRNHRVQKFRTAESLFARALQSQPADATGSQNPELFVNLGNAALGAEHVGPAVLAYRRALQADPNHARARQNLEYARTLIASWVPKPEEKISLDSFFDWTQHWDSSDWRGMAAIAFLVAAVCFSLYLRFENKSWRNLGFVLALLWLLVLAGSYFLPGQSEAIAAVVVIPETTARSADSIHSPPRFPAPLPGGTEVEIIEDRGDWLRVRLYDGREVWIADSALESI